MIDYPIAPRTYVKIDETHITGPSYKHSFEGFVCNSISDFMRCKSNYLNCLGIGENDNVLIKFEKPYALITSEYAILNNTYNVPVLGVSYKHFSYGTSTTTPFYVKVYETDWGELMFKYIVIGFVCLLFTLSMYNCIAKRINGCLQRRRIMKTKHFKEGSLLNSNCTICLDDFSNNEKLVELTQCRHTFHKECINTWLDTKQTCPNCQHNII